MTWAAFSRVVSAAVDVPGLVLPRDLRVNLPDPSYCEAAPQAGRGLDRLREQEGPLPWERALLLGERIVEVLANVHAATGIAHRALLPSRCIVTVRDDVRILDYGVAEIELAGGRADDSGYRAPEQQGGAGDHRSDIFSLAVILFELISGQRPHQTPLVFPPHPPPQPLNVTRISALRAAIRGVIVSGAPLVEPAKPAPGAGVTPQELATGNIVPTGRTARR